MALVVLGALAGACSSPAAESAAPTRSEPPTVVATPTATPAPTLERLLGSFDIGGGRKLYLQCAGTGSPTVLLEAGDTDPGPDHWQAVIPGLVRDADARVCTYDRLGLGKSSRATGCRELDDLLDDLDALLASAKLEPPYVLVGASGGGFIMAGFAARHPETVAGMVFVETPKALTAKLYPEVLPTVKCTAPGNTERRDYVAVEHAAWDNRKRVGDFPLVVMSNQYGPGADRDDATNVEDQRGWFVLSPDKATQIVVRSGHGIASDQPELVIKQILAVLDAARG
jgi:pimeloyl-ACP methyl ester carboxylesterase